MMSKVYYNLGKSGLGYVRTLKVFNGRSEHTEA